MKFVLSTLVVLSSFAVLSQTACAHPNYPQNQPSGIQETKPGTATCPLKFDSENLCADYVWTTAPTEEATGSFTLKFWSSIDQSAQDPKMSLKVLTWMPDMGHGSAPIKLTHTAQGEYLAENVFFSMPGAWQLRFQLKNANAVVEEQIADVNF